MYQQYDDDLFFVPMAMLERDEHEGEDLSIDYETACDLNLKIVGLDQYSSHPSCRVLMVAWKWGRRATQQWTIEDGTPFPEELVRALKNPKVKKWAFNAQFERIITKRVLKIDTPYEGWRCTMVLAFTQSFTGTLGQIGEQVGAPIDKLKSTSGDRLIRLFCAPRKPTTANPLVWRNAWTHPEEWEEFCDYNRQDVEAEWEIKRRLIKYPVQEHEWELYCLDQETNDRGIPIDREFMESAIRLSALRKAELTAEMRDICGLKNPNSPAQLLPWMKERGYPFNDLKKDTIKKTINEHEEKIVELDDDDLIDMLYLRQKAARTATAKYTRLKITCVDLGDGAGYRFRFGFQFGGASRTNRAAGRGLNPQNLSRTPKEIEVDEKMYAQLGVSGDFLLVYVTKLIRDGDYEMLKLTVKEPLDALAGCVRSVIAAPEGYEFRACDLSSIETCCIGWLAGCVRLLNVFASGKDPYIDFATDMFSTSYDLVTKRQRQEAKPAVLGSGFRLGGGELKEGKRTGLWAYAESMGVNMTKEQSHKATKLFREGYPEIPKLWYALEEAIISAMRTKRPTKPTIRTGSKLFEVPVVFEYMKPYMTILLPSGRRMYYHKPRITKETRYSKPTPDYPDGKPYEKTVFSYMGKEQGSNVWKRLYTHGGKLVENIVQAVARDILMIGMRKAIDAGFKLVMHVHDELVALVKKGDNFFTVEFMRELMIEREDWYENGTVGLPLNAAGSSYDFYRKD